MLYCKIENNKISNPDRLVNLLSNVINPGALEAQELKEKNIYLYQDPVLDYITQKPGELIFDETNEVVTREVTDKIFDIQAEKDKKIQQIKRHVNNLLKSTDIYFIRKMERGKNVPSEIQNERNFIHSESDRMQNEINDITTAKDVITYNFKLDNLSYHVEESSF